MDTAFVVVQEHSGSFTADEEQHDFGDGKSAHELERNLYLSRTLSVIETHHGHADLVADFHRVPKPDFADTGYHIARHVPANCCPKTSHDSCPLDNSGALVSVKVVVGVAREIEVRSAPFGAEAQDGFAREARS